MMISTVLEGGTILDGSGAGRFVTDVAVVGDRIERIGNCLEFEARRRIDCTGLIVAPGFIDSGSWTQADTLAVQASGAKLAQGVTTEITGGLQRIALHDSAGGFLDAVSEIAEYAVRSELPVHLSDLHIEWTNDRGRMHHALEIIDRANARGAHITCDVVPYVATWVPLDALPMLHSHWHDVVLAEVASEERLAWCGMRFDDIAAQRRLTPADAVADFVRTEGSRAMAFVFCINEDDIATALSAPFCAIGSGAPAFPVAYQPYGLVHPRAYGTFARALGRYVRGRHTLRLEEAVARMTSLPARTFGLGDRGRVAEGLRADLIVFDEMKFRDTATYDHPVALPVGIHHLFAGGGEVRIEGSFL